MKTAKTLLLSLCLIVYMAGGALASAPLLTAEEVIVDGRSHVMTIRMGKVEKIVESLLERSAEGSGWKERPELREYFSEGRFRCPGGALRCIEKGSLSYHLDMEKNILQCRGKFTPGVLAGKEFFGSLNLLMAPALERLLEYYRFCSPAKEGDALDRLIRRSFLAAPLRIMVIRAAFQERDGFLYARCALKRLPDGMSSGRSLLVKRLRFAESCEGSREITDVLLKQFKDTVVQECSAFGLAVDSVEKEERVVLRFRITGMEAPFRLVNDPLWQRTVVVAASVVKGKREICRKTVRAPGVGISREMAEREAVKRGAKLALRELLVLLIPLEIESLMAAGPSAK